MSIKISCFFTGKLLFKKERRRSPFKIFLGKAEAILFFASVEKARYSEIEKHLYELKEIL